MWLDIHGHGTDWTPELRTTLEDRVSAALARFDGRLGRVSVFAADQNGPTKKGPDKELRIVVEVKGVDTVVVEDTDVTWLAVIDRIVDRTVHTVAKRLDRLHHDRQHSAT